MCRWKLPESPREKFFIVGREIDFLCRKVVGIPPPREVPDKGEDKSGEVMGTVPPARSPIAVDFDDNLWIFRAIKPHPPAAHTLVFMHELEDWFRSIVMRARIVPFLGGGRQLIG